MPDAIIVIGRLVITRDAEELAKKLFGQAGGFTRLAAMLARHATGDWGDLNAAGKAQNDDAVLNGKRVFSAYEFNGSEFWIITDADRSKTTIMLPTDF